MPKKTSEQEHARKGTGKPGVRGRATRKSRKAKLDPAHLSDDLTPHEIGVLGEAIAASYLEDRGYEVLEHGYRCREGEADLIAYDYDSNEVVLVEVKSRRARPGEDVRPEEAVDGRKRARYRRIASWYVMDRFPVLSIRFDVVSVVFYTGKDAGITHFFSVFDWEVS